MKNALTALGFAFVLGTVALPGCGGSDADTGGEQDVTVANGTFETFVGADGQHYFQLIASNGERVLRSEGYSSITSAKKGIASVKKNGVLASAYKVLTAQNGETYFNIVAANGEIIGTSEMYSTKSNATRAVTTVKSIVASVVSAEAKTGTPKFETFTGQDGKTYFHLRAGNGEIVFQSQGYSSKSGATSGIASVKKNGADASNYEVVAAQNNQFYFRLKAANGQIIGQGETYVTKSNAFRGVDTVRDLLRDLGSAGTVSDTEIQAEIERAATGLTFMSEADYPYGFVLADLPGTSTKVTEQLVRSKLSSYTDKDEDADKPMASLFAMTSTWDEWKGEEIGCGELLDADEIKTCAQQRNLEQVIENNLTDIHVYYFGSVGEPGFVDGIGVSVFIVGRTPSGNLAGVRTLAIWT